MGLGFVVIEVVLPTYNGAAFLEAQLASIDAQTLQPQRVIIRDDGSQDGTSSVEPIAKALRELNCSFPFSRQLGMCWQYQLPFVGNTCALRGTGRSG